MYSGAMIWESLRDIEACLRAVGPRLYHMGIRSTISRNTLSSANKNRDWRIYAEFAQVLIQQAKELYADDSAFPDLIWIAICVYLLVAITKKEFK